MKTRWLASLLLLIPGACAGYMAWLSWRAGDDGKWLFGVLAAFFLILAAAPFLPKSAASPRPDTVSANTRFAPHWFMLLALLVTVAGIALAVLSAILRH